jgi:hypothetical protein
MMSFNDKDDIIMYWDEPTISLDYETHELHGEIKPCGKKTRSPSFCRARLPDETEIRETLYNFKERFENAEIATIKSYDCKRRFLYWTQIRCALFPLAAVSRLRRIEIVFGELR